MEIFFVISEPCLLGVTGMSLIDTPYTRLLLSGYKVNLFLQWCPNTSNGSSVTDATGQ